MADFSVLDSNTGMVLDSTLVSWLEIQPQFNIAIKPRAQAGTMPRAVAQVQLPVYLIPDLIANISDPNSSGLVQVNDKLNGISTVGRFNLDFTITNNNGSGRVSLNEPQWRSLIEYFNNFYLKATEIKAIGRCVRMHFINLLREIGLDTPDGNNRFKTTPWYDYQYDTVKNFPKNNNNKPNNTVNRNYNPNYNNVQNKNFNSVDDASYRKTSTGFGQGGNSYNQQRVNPAPSSGTPLNMRGMPPLANNTQQANTQQGGMNNPVSDNNTRSGSTIPMGVPMPDIQMSGNAQNPNENTAMYNDSIQDMLNATFKQ